MPVKTADRPIEQVRQETIDVLVMNYGHEKISLEAFERRLDEAMGIDDPVLLEKLVEDLDKDIDADFVKSQRAKMSPTNDFDIHSGRVKQSEQIVHIFGSSERTGIWDVPKEINVLNVFGSGDLDFTDARFHSQTVVIKVFSLFGSQDIFVPENVNVHVNLFNIFGGVSDSSNTVPEQTAPTIVIEGTFIFSGMDIKIRKTLKERVMQFADSIKRMLS